MRHVSSRSHRRAAVDPSAASRRANSSIVSPTTHSRSHRGVAWRMRNSASRIIRAPSAGARCRRSCRQTPGTRPSARAPRGSSSKCLRRRPPRCAVGSPIHDRTSRFCSSRSSVVYTALIDSCRPARVSISRRTVAPYASGPRRSSARSTSCSKSPSAMAEVCSTLWTIFKDRPFSGSERSGSSRVGENTERRENGRKLGVIQAPPNCSLSPILPLSCSLVTCACGAANHFPGAAMVP